MTDNLPLGALQDPRAPWNNPEHKCPQCYAVMYEADYDEHGVPIMKCDECNFIKL